MRRTLILSIIILCAIIGMIDAGYLAESALSDTALSCGIEGLEGCNVVAQSPYGQYFGIPLGVYGIGFYILIFVLALMLRYASSIKVPLLPALRILAGAGSIASVYFLILQFFVIEALCIYCMLSALLTFMIFGLSLALRRPAPVPASPVVP